MKSTQSGFTIIEIIVALGIFGFLASAFLYFMIGSLKVNTQTRADQAVTISAKRFMEGVRAEYDKLQDATPKKELSELNLAAVPVPTTTETGGYACKATNSDQEKDGSVVLIKRVTLTCTKADAGSQVFSLDFGRPL